MSNSDSGGMESETEAGSAPNTRWADVDEVTDTDEERLSRIIGALVALVAGDSDHLLAEKTDDHKHIVLLYQKQDGSLVPLVVVPDSDSVEQYKPSGYSSTKNTETKEMDDSNP